MNLRKAAAVLAAAVFGEAIGSTKHRASELHDSYDFIIAGGGTSGLTVADRLTEAFSSSKKP
jgi:choline dehydrogenase